MMLLGFGLVGSSMRSRIRPIPTTDYPTPAKRPANSVLDCTRIAADWDIALPHWEESCQRVVTEIVRG